MTPTDPTDLPRELVDLVEDSRSNWVPGPIRTSDFHGSVRRRIRRRNTRNGALLACAAVAIVAIAFRLGNPGSEPESPPTQEVAEQAPAIEAPLPLLDRDETVVAIAEGNLPDLSADPILEPWFDNALRNNVPLGGLASEYGPLGSLYLGGASR